MKKIITASLLSLCLPVAAQADVLGFTIGVNAWQQNFSGDAKNGPDKISIDNDLGFDDDNGFQGYISFEHPIPIIPNILVQHTIIDVDANGALNNIEFDGVTFNGPVQSTIDLTHTDATLYYELLDNWISLDLGITGRLFENGVEIEGGGERATVDVDAVIPMLYAAVKFELPLSGLYIGADGNGVTYDNNTLIDVKAKLGWESGWGLGIELGYRYFDIQYEDNKEEVDATIDGPFAGVFFHF